MTFKDCIHKDCIHFEACDNILKRYAGLALNPYNPCVCAYFKDTARFIVLPCRIGDTIYYLEGETFTDDNGVKHESLQPDHVAEMKFNVHCLNNDGTLASCYFLKKIEAEKALLGIMKGEQNNAEQG